MDNRVLIFRIKDFPLSLVQHKLKGFCTTIIKIKDNPRPFTMYEFANHSSRFNIAPIILMDF